MHIRNDPSFFLTNRTGAPHGDELGLIKPLSEALVVDPQLFLKWTGASTQRQNDGIVAGQLYSPWPGGPASWQLCILCVQGT
ncbi:hypothetical protein Tco_0462614 [Tanacetum coccineum]